MCGKDIYILNTQGVLVNFRALAEFKKDNRHVYMEVKLQWLWDGHKEHLLSITGQTNQTWGQRRHMTNADLFASKHTFTCTHTPTSPLPFPTGSLLSIHLSSQPCDQEKTSFHFLSVSRGLALRSFIPGQHEQWLISSLIKERSGRREAHWRRL